VLASQDLEARTTSGRRLQIGDPFRGKALIEVSLDLVRERPRRSACRTAAPPGLRRRWPRLLQQEAGVDVHLDRVPLREADLDPWEI